MVFNKVTKIPDVNAEPFLTLEKDETLWCTPMVRSVNLNHKQFFHLRDRSRLNLRKSGKILDGDELKKAVIDALKLPPYRQSSGFPHFTSRNRPALSKEICS